MHPSLTYISEKFSMTKSTLLVSIVLLAATLNSFAADSHHDRDFWRAIAKAHYAVPEHESADALSHELSTMLASPDPELRDDLAYSISRPLDLSPERTLHAHAPLPHRRVARQPPHWTRRSRNKFRLATILLRALSFGDGEP